MKGRTISPGKAEGKAIGSGETIAFPSAFPGKGNSFT